MQTESGKEIFGYHRRYTEGKKKLIAELIEEAKMWEKKSDVFLLPPVILE